MDKQMESENTIADDGLAPVICTLSTTDRKSQELEWADLSSLATASKPLASGVVSTFPIEIIDQLQDLVDREVDCCGSWLQLRLTTVADQATLEVTTSNTDGVPLIWALAGHQE